MGQKTFADAKVFLTDRIFLIAKETRYDKVYAPRVSR